MLSLQNPHHLGAAASAAGPMAPRRQFPSPSRIPHDSLGSTAQLNHQRNINAGFKAVMSKMEKNGNDETVPDENDCAPRSHSHGSTSGSGSFSGSGERRRLKRRREEEEEDEDNAEDDRAHEEDRNRETERRRMDTIWIRGKNKLEEDDDEEEEVDDDDDEEGGVGEGGSDPGVIQKEILMQKPLGLLAQHGLSSRTPSSAKFHRKNSHDDEGLEEDEEEKRRSGGMREEEEEEDVRNGRTEDLEAGGEVNRPDKSLFLKSPSGGTGGHRRLYSSNQSDGDEEQVAAENVLSSRGCHDIGNFASHISLMDQRFMPSPPLSASPESGQDPSTPGGHHWTFEEQFKQLYELTDDPNRKLFLDDLFSFMQKRGTPVNRIPIMAKQTLDLFELFQLVVSKGGLVEVINKKLWREITKGLNLPSSITSAAFTLRTQYMKYLYPYECEKLKLSTLSELQYAVDGNRREGRRSGFGQDFSPLPPILPMNPAAVAHMHDGLSGVNQGGRSAVSLSLNDRGDQQMILAPTVNQLRTLAECDAHAVKAATRAMAEVSKRMEEATRAAAVSSSIRFVGGQGQGPPSCPQSTNNVSMMKTEEPVTKRPTIDDGVRFPTPLHRTNSSGVSTAHIKLTSRENGHSNHLGGSIIGSMEINGILYQGVLFAQPPSTHLLD